MLAYIKKIYDKLFVAVQQFIIKRDSLKEILNNEVTLLDDTILPQLRTIKTEIENKTLDVNFLTKNDLIKNIISYLDKKPRSAYELFVLLEARCEAIKEFHTDLNSLLSKHVPSAVTDKTVTLKELGLISFVNNVGAFRAYLEDLNYYVITLFTSNMVPYKKTVERLRTDSLNFAKLVTFFDKKSIEDFKKKVTEIQSVSTLDVINAGDTLGEKALDPKVSQASSLFTLSFTGNPLYHFRIWLEDRRHRTYEKNKAKKEYFELTIQDIKRKSATGASDPNVENQIKYYENLIVKLEYEIAKYEEE